MVDIIGFVCNLGTLIPSKDYADPHPFNDETNQKIPDCRNSLSQTGQVLRKAGK
jgi:hypothetical protein